MHDLPIYILKQAAEVKLNSLMIPPHKFLDLSKTFSLNMDCISISDINQHNVTNGQHITNLM